MNRAFDDRRGMTSLPDSEGRIDPERLPELREQQLTEEVVSSFARTPSPRQRALMQSLVRHLHAFIREVRLTDQEWRAGIDFLTRTGRITDHNRQEFVLLSDVLGASMQTVMVNQPAEPTVTASTVYGPFFLSESPRFDLGDDLARGAPGTPCLVQGSVRGVGGTPVGGARIEVWGADEDGLYDVQREDAAPANRGHIFTDSDGRFHFWSIRPTAYPIPTDGPVGELLRAARRSAMRPAHLHFLVSAPGWRTLVTHVFAAGDPHLGHDAVFGVQQSLVVPIQDHPATEAPPGGQIQGPWASFSYDFLLAAEVPGPELGADGSGVAAGAG